MSFRKCCVQGCTNRVRSGLVTTIDSRDGLADGFTCGKHRAADRQRYQRMRCAKCNDPRSEHTANHTRDHNFVEKQGAR